jgi:hypothetical protein
VFNALIFPFADISVRPDFNGLPSNLTAGLEHLTNNAAAVLLLVSGLGIVLSLMGMVAGSWVHSPHLRERSREGLLVSAGAGALLFGAVAIANYSTGLFR